MADTIEGLKQQLDDLKKKLEDSKKGVNDIADSSGRIKTLSDSFSSVKTSIESTNKAAGTLIENLAKTNNVKLDGAIGAFSSLSKAILGSGDSTNTYASMMTSLGGVLNNVLGPEMAKLFTTATVDLPAAFDALTGTTREFKKDTLDLGSTYGLTYDQIVGKTLAYQNAILFANNYTFEGIEAVRKAAASAADYGIGIDELTKSFTVAGHEQSFLSEGFLLSSDTGLSATDVFKKMAEASRVMGYSVEDAGKPLVAMENIARATGLPITDVGDKVFRTAREFSRLGLTVDGIEPVVRRFAEVLGPSFKGLAIDETTKLFDNLKSKVNSTEAAFIAMRGGLAGPGAGVAEAQLAFEDAFKNPVDIMKSLTTTLSGVTGGKIIKFEEARANPELSNQFKIQRDLLGQLTGNTDPQSQRTLMSILADLQSGRQLTASQDKTLQDSLKSGQQKQDETANIQQQLNRITIGLQTEMNVSLGNILNRLVPSQVQGELARKAGSAAETGYEQAIRMAQELGGRISTFAEGKGLDLSGISGKVNSAVSSQLPGPELGDAPRFRARVDPFAARTGVPEPSRLVTPTVSPPIVTQTTPGAVASASGAAGEKAPNNITITLRATDELTRTIAEGATVSYNRTLHGNG